MSCTLQTDLGVITIENSVIANVAGLAAMESYGIVGMAAKNATDGFFELLKSDYFAKGITVRSEPDLEIDLHVILEYGVNIATVAENIVERVKFSVEKMTSLKVHHINVFVQGIRIEK